MQTTKAQNLIYKDEAFKIIGAAMDVHSELGCGFLEAVYAEALEIEFNLRNIPYKKNAAIGINYKGITLNKTYIPDYICYDKIIVELKAISKFENINNAQVINYLKATNYKLGILCNFGEQRLNYKRLVL
jgi:GxxExxY protein